MKRIKQWNQQETSEKNKNLTLASFVPTCRNVVDLSADLCDGNPAIGTPPAQWNAFAVYIPSGLNLFGFHVYLGHGNDSLPCGIPFAGLTAGDISLGRSEFNRDSSGIWYRGLPS